MQKLFLYTSIILTLCSCSEQSQSSSNSGVTPQTTLMYMTGTDLSSFFSSNISSVQEAVSKSGLGDGRFVVFRHSTSTSATLTEYKLEKGNCTATTLKSYDTITSLTQEAIVEVVADTKELAPADSYNLIISGHATGWVVKTRQTNTWSAPSATTTSSAAVDWEAMITSPIVTRYLGSTNDGFFDISELKESLDATQTLFHTIIFDECFMSSVEALYDLRNNCSYIIASPCEIMGPGFPYDTVIPKLFSQQGYTVDHQGICEAFYEYYTDYTYPSGCIALTVTSELDALSSIIKQINTDYSDEQVDISSLQTYERLASPIFYDLEQYILAKCNNVTLAEEFTTQMELTFPTQCRFHTDRFFANIGVSASSSNNYDAYFKTIEYYSGITTSAPSEQMSSEWVETAWSIAIN